MRTIAIVIIWAVLASGCDFLDERSGTCPAPRGLGKTVIVGDDGVMFVEDAGWREVFLTDVDLNAVTYQDSLVGFAVGQTGVVLRTTDGGSTWEATENGTADLRDVDSPDGCSTVMAAGSTQLLRTTDNGDSWDRVTLELDDALTWFGGFDGPEDWSGFGVSFFDGSSGMALGVVPSYFGSTITLALMSSDGGRTWSEVETEDVRSIDLINAQALSAAGDHGVLALIGGPFRDTGTFYSRDLGASWARDEEDVFMRSVQDINVQEDGKGVAVGVDGGVYVTNNGWQTWRQAVSGVEEDLYGVDCEGARCLAVGESGTVIASENGGLSWALVDLGTNARLRAVVVGD